MSQHENDLVYNVKLVEKYKRALPDLKRRLEEDSFFYIAGTLVVNGPDPVENSKYITIDIEQIGDYESEIIREAMYLASLIFVKHKKETCFRYQTALSNIEEYERIHGCDRSAAGTAVS